MAMESLTEIKYIVRDEGIYSVALFTILLPCQVWMAQRCAGLRLGPGGVILWA